MEKKDFILAMKKIIESEDAFCNLEDAIHEVSDTSYKPIISKHIDTCMDIIKIVMEDKSDWISYWFYDLSKGKKYKKGMVTKGGKNIKMKTLEDLYNCINNKN